jgi:hypothetical protein
VEQFELLGERADCMLTLLSIKQLLIALFTRAYFRFIDETNFVIMQLISPAAPRM